MGPDNVVREKPVDAAEARAMIATYAGASARTVSSIVVTNTRTGEQVTGVDICTIQFDAGLGADASMAVLLQPAVPVDVASLQRFMHPVAAAAATSATDAAATSGVSAATASGAAAAVVMCDVFASAGALSIEHPAYSAHVTSIVGDIDSIQGELERGKSGWGVVGIQCSQTAFPVDLLR